MTPSVPVYHLELRAFPSVARIFNLDRDTLDARYLRPYSAGDAIDHDDRRWPADKTKLTVWYGPPVPTTSRGLGRGWGEVTRAGEEVTESVIAQARRGAEGRPEVEALKDGLAESAAGAGVSFPDVVALAAVAHPGWKVSEQLALAEQAVWELLHQHRLQLLRDAEPLAAEHWQEVVLSWATWTAGESLRLRAPVADTDG